MTPDFSKLIERLNNFAKMHKAGGATGTADLLTEAATALQFLTSTIAGLEVEGWREIESAPTSEAEPFIVLLPGNSSADSIEMQVTRFEGEMYPDHLDNNVDWKDRITTATHWRPRTAPPAAISRARG